MTDQDGVAPTTMAEAFDMGAEEVEVAGSPTPSPTPEPVPESPKPETVSEPEVQGQPRSPDGKFASKPAADAPAPVEGEPVAETAPAEPEPAAVDLSSYSPFTFRAAGRELPFEGSLASEHGAWFPKDSLPQLARQLAAAVHATELGQRYSTERKALEAQHSEQMESVKVELTATQNLVAQFDILRQQALTDPEGVIAFLQDQRGWDLWLAKSEKAKQDAQLALLKRKDESRNQEQTRQNQMPLMQRDFSTTLDGLMQEATKLGYPLDRSKLEGRLTSQWDRIFRPATEQDIQNGYPGKVGEMLFDKGPMIAEVRWAADLLQAARPKDVPKPVAKTNPVPPAARSKAPSQGTVGEKKETPTYANAKEAFESAFN